MSRSIFIVGIGARTPLGASAAPSAAAVRAGVAGISEHPFMVDVVGDRMPAALDPELDPRVMGPERLLGLAETALREACEALAAARTPRLRLPLFLGLPEFRPGFDEADAEAVRSGLSRLEGLPAEIASATVFSQGHAAGFSALNAAVEQLRQGAVEACLVGGVDSYFHPDTMEWLDANRQLVGAVSRSGFVPGEGAGFCLLMNESARDRRGLSALAGVVSVATGSEPNRIKTDDLCFGEGLTSTVQRALSSLRLPDERINEIYCDINGERYRSEEWGFICLRLNPNFDDPTAYLSPAENWGDVGAASGPLYAMLACRAFARRYAKGPRCLLWASSEGGQRGAAVLESASRP